MNRVSGCELTDCALPSRAVQSVVGWGWRRCDKEGSDQSNTCRHKIKEQRHGCRGQILDVHKRAGRKRNHDGPPHSLRTRAVSGA